MTKGGCRFCDALIPWDGAEYLAEVKEGILFVGDRRPTEQQLAELKNEVELLERTNLWKLFTQTMRNQAIDMGIKRATDYDQLMFSKAMLHCVGILESAVKVIKETPSMNEGQKKV